MRYKKIISAEEANMIVKRPLKLHGGLRLLNKLILRAAIFGCYELYLSPSYTTCIKKKRYYYKLDERETNVLFDWNRMDYLEMYLHKNGYWTDYDWILKKYTIKWRL